MISEQQEIFDKLYPGYPLDLGAISAIVERIANWPNRDNQSIIDLINKAEKEGGRENAIKLAQLLAEVNDNYRRLLDKATSKRGRIAKKLKKDISQALKSTVHEMGVYTPRNSPTTSAQILTLDSSNTNLSNLPSLFWKLSEYEKKDVDAEIEMPDFVYASGLAVVAAWLKASQGRNAFIGRANSRTRDYAERIGFLDLIENRNSSSGRLDTSEEWAIRLTAINSSTQAQTVTTDVLDIIGTFISLNKQDRQTFGIILSELIENVPRHAETDNPAFVVCQVYPEKMKLGITIADSGIGIKESFLRGEIDEYKTTDKPDSFFINLALKMLITSKTSGHAGYGLFLFSEVVAKNRGTFWVASGGESVVGYLHKGIVKKDIIKHNYWQGTVVSMIIDLYNTLPLVEVYKSMPPIKGYEEDLFQD